MTSEIEKISILAAPRSGTTALGEFIEYITDAAYWVEPKYIWLYNADYSSGDYRSAKDATADTTKYIRRRFNRFTKANSKTTFLEKTPSNVMRLDFVREVLPEAKVVWLIRHPLEFAKSYKEKGTRNITTDVIVRRIKNRDLTFNFIRKNTRHILQLIWQALVKTRLENHWGIKGVKIQSDDDILRLWITIHKEILSAIESRLFDNSVLFTYTELIQIGPSNVQQQICQSLNISPKRDASTWTGEFRRRKSSDLPLITNPNLESEALHLYDSLRKYSCRE